MVDPIAAGYIMVDPIAVDFITVVPIRTSSVTIGPTTIIVSPKVTHKDKLFL